MGLIWAYYLFSNGKVRIFTGRTDTKAEAPILWPSDANNRLSEKDIEAGKD